MMKLHLHFTLPGYGFLKVCQVGRWLFSKLTWLQLLFTTAKLLRPPKLPKFLWLKFVTAKAEQRAGWRNDLLFFDSCIFRFFS